MRLGLILKYDDLKYYCGKFLNDWTSFLLQQENET